MRTNRWWLFSWNKPPIVVNEGVPHIVEYRPPWEYVLPYVYDAERDVWYRWASIAKQWIPEPAHTLCTKNRVELTLIKS